MLFCVEQFERVMFLLVHACQQYSLHLQPSPHISRARCAREVRHIRALAKRNHDDALPKLQKRLANLGFRDTDLWMTPRGTQQEAIKIWKWLAPNWPRVAPLQRQVASGKRAWGCKGWQKSNPRFGLDIGAFLLNL